MKRFATVPAGPCEKASKMDLLEAAWDLAALCNDSGSVDDDASTRAKLIEFINIRRAKRNAPAIRGERPK